MHQPKTRRRKNAPAGNNLISGGSKWCSLLCIACAAACLTLSPIAHAVSPAPGGGYPGQNTALGDFALLNLTTGIANTALGYASLDSNTTGVGNTGAGLGTLYHNVTGSYNTATGLYALYLTTVGSNNVATGYNALASNMDGNNNTAIGYRTLLSNTASNNTATGYQALFSNTTGSYNTATGVHALYANTTGIFNTAVGASALVHNTTSNYNSALGINALFRNTTGAANTAVGFATLFDNTTGGNNIAIGNSAGKNLTTGSSNIDIGNPGVAAESNVIRIGAAQSKAFLAGVRNAVVAGGIAVYASATGQLGTNPSSKRFKQDIATMNKQSESILALHPVSFHYRKELDPDEVPQFGLVAEEVAKVNPDLIIRDDKGEIYSVRYEAVNAMLLNEFLKEHRKVEKIEATTAQQQKEFRSAIEEQRREIAALTKALQTQAAQLLKVTAAVSAQAPKTLLAETTR